MTRKETRDISKRKALTEILPFTKINYQIFGFGILLIILGYIALGQEPWDGSMPLIVAPILLVLGYCVVIPFGILYRKRKETETIVQQQPDVNAENSR
jgi:ABC-type polysaccharide/polyol phosphate export permease